MSNEALVAIIVAIFASSGFWSFITSRFAAKDTKKCHEDEEMKKQSNMLKGLGHTYIIALGTRYIERGYITKDEYEDLKDYLYEPYAKLGGNGTAEKIMKEVEKLPIHEHHERR